MMRFGILWVFCAFASPVWAEPLVEFGPSRTLATSNSSWGSYVNPQLMELSDGSIGIGWLDAIDRVYFSRSTDGGSSWTASVQINDTTTGDRYWPRFSVAPTGEIYAAWQDYRRTGSSDSEIYFTKSTDFGATWSANEAVYGSLGGDQLIAWGATAGPDGAFHVVYGQDKGARYDSTSVFIRSSDDGGATFAPEVQISPSDLARATYPAVQIDEDGAINLIYSGTDIQSRLHPDPRTYFVRSEDGGRTWSAPVLVDPYTGNTGDGGVQTHLRRAEDGTLYATWTDARNGDSDIYFSRSTDDGQTWSAVQRVNDISVGHQRRPSVAVVGDEIYMLWSDEAGERIRMSVSRDGGLTWSESFAVEDGAAGLRRTPSLLAIDGSLFAAWGQQTADGWEVRFASAQTSQPVPEPGTLVTVAAAAALLAWRRRVVRR